MTASSSPHTPTAPFEHGRAVRLGSRGRWSHPEGLTMRITAAIVAACGTTAICSFLITGCKSTAEPPRVAAPVFADTSRVLRGAEAFGDWRKDAPGVRRLIRAEDAPPITESLQNEVAVVPQPAGALPRVPDGFTVERVATGLAQPRVIRTAPNGDLFVANSKKNEVLLYRLEPGTGRVVEESVFASGLNKPYGIAFYPANAETQWVYIANCDSVVRIPYQSGDLKAREEPQVIIDKLPPAHHWTKDIAFSADGKRLFLAIGSGSNVALDMFPEPREPKGIEAWNKVNPLGAAWDTEEGRAAVHVCDPDGGNKQLFSTGLRNPAGITIQPQTGILWAVVNERDGLGDDGPFEYATRVREGTFFGWPWFYIGDRQDPRHPGARPDLRGKISLGDVMIQAHSAALQIAFHPGKGFPASYRGSAFVTLHGSWDRGKRTGYKVVRLLIDEAGNPTGEYEDFMTGFVLSEKEVWGRPVGVTVGADGSLFVTEDGNGSIWRVSHREALR